MAVAVAAVEAVAVAVAVEVAVGGHLLLPLLSLRSLLQLLGRGLRGSVGLSAKLLLARARACELRAQSCHLRIADILCSGLVRSFACRRGGGCLCGLGVLGQPSLGCGELPLEGALPGRRVARRASSRSVPARGLLHDSEADLCPNLTHCRRNRRGRGAAQRVQLAPEGKSHLQALCERRALAPQCHGRSLLLPIPITFGCAQ